MGWQPGAAMAPLRGQRHQDGPAEGRTRLPSEGLQTGPALGFGSH